MERVYIVHKRLNDFCNVSPSIAIITGITTDDFWATKCDYVFIAPTGVPHGCRACRSLFKHTRTFGMMSSPSQPFLIIIYVGVVSVAGQTHSISFCIHFSVDHIRFISVFLCFETLLRWRFNIRNAAPVLPHRYVPSRNAIEINCEWIISCV